MTVGRLLAALLALASMAAQADAVSLDRLDRALSAQSPGGFLRANVSGVLDVAGYYIDQPPPGLLVTDDHWLGAPRLSVLLDLRAGSRLYCFVRAQADRGFDPLERPDGSVRLDEWLLRWTPLATPLLNLQAGKFATVIGNWVARHDPWTNPFVNAPLPYEHVTTVGDSRVPASLQAFLARRNVPDQKDDWVPTVWGPNYTTGAALFGRLGQMDYAAEVKNAALSARSYEWGPEARGWEHPTAGGRLGWRPAAPWVFGVSASSGPYLQDDATRTLAPGQHVGDFRQTVVGTDGAFSWRHLELWGEFFVSRFQVPIAARRSPREVDADTAAYYLEGRYRLSPHLAAALRWNQQLFGDVPDGHGGEAAWDRNAFRVDTALAYRFDRHFQVKLQHAFTHQTGTLQQGQQMVAAEMTLRF